MGRVARQDDLAGAFDDTLVQRTSRRSAQCRKSAARKRIRGGPQSGVDVVTHRASGIGEHPGQVEPIADAQGQGADFVGELGLQVVAPTSGDPVKFGANVQQRQMGAAQRSGRRIGRQTG